MKLIVISTHAEYSKGRSFEQEALMKMFDAGLTDFHLRKPTFSAPQMKDWLDGIDSCYHQYITVHSYYDLAIEYGLRGIHFTSSQLHPGNRKNSNDQVHFLLGIKPDLRLTASFHSLDELRFAPAKYNYVFLSPIYNSVSKEYNGASYDFDELRKAIPLARNPVVALGGIKSNNIHETLSLGFDGVASLGSVWNSSPLESFRELYSVFQSEIDICLP